MFSPLPTDLPQPSVPGRTQIHQPMVWWAPQHQLFFPVTGTAEAVSSAPH